MRSIFLYGKEVEKIVKGEKFYLIFFTDSTCKCVDVERFENYNWGYFKTLSDDIVKVYDVMYCAFCHKFFYIFKDGTCFSSNCNLLMLAFIKHFENSVSIRLVRGTNCTVIEVV